MTLRTRASEAASIDGVWAYGRNFSVYELGRGHVIRNVHKWIYHNISVHDKLKVTAFPLSLFFGLMEGVTIVTPELPLSPSPSVSAPAIGCHFQALLCRIYCVGFVSYCPHIRRGRCCSHQGPCPLRGS